MFISEWSLPFGVRKKGVAPAGKYERYRTECSTFVSLFAQKSVMRKVGPECWNANSKTKLSKTAEKDPVGNSDQHGVQ